MKPNYRKPNYRDYQVVLEVSDGDVRVRKPVKVSKKSYLGCFNCKRKKVKCDETKDVCKNCRHGNLECLWPEEADINQRRRNGRAKSLKSNQDQEFEFPNQHDFCHEFLTDFDFEIENQLQVSPRPYSPICPTTNTLQQGQIDIFLFSQFSERFFPTLGRVQFHDICSTTLLVDTMIQESPLLKEIFIACGAVTVAFDDSRYQDLSRQRSLRAISQFRKEMKICSSANYESKLFVAVQAMQTLSLRDSNNSGCNASASAFHLNAAFKIIMKLLTNESPVAWQIHSPLEKAMIENFLFNYPFIIFFCGKIQLQQLIPEPFQFFADSNAKLMEMYLDDASRISFISLQLAAKCAWLYRLKLPFDAIDLSICNGLLQTVNSCIQLLEDIGHHHSVINPTFSVANVVLKMTLILLTKMLDLENVRAMQFQDMIHEIIYHISQPGNEHVMFPSWVLVMAGSTALDACDRQFFLQKIGEICHKSGSNVIMQLNTYLKGSLETLKLDEPFEALFDPTFVKRYT